MVMCVSGSRGEENALVKSACLDRLSHGCLSLMDAPRPHTTNEQPLRESERSETKAKQDQPGIFVYKYLWKSAGNSLSLIDSIND